MALTETTRPAAGKIITGLFGASFVAAGVMLGASVIAGLQFSETGGVPDTVGIVMFVLMYVFFATPIMAALVFPLGAATVWGLGRIGLLTLWAIILVGLLIGYALSWLVPLLPDIILLSQLPSPIREISSTLGGGAAALVFWLLAQPKPREDATPA
jgi:hypothetical protein